MLRFIDDALPNVINLLWIHQRGFTRGNLPMEFNARVFLRIINLFVNTLSPRRHARGGHAVKQEG
jgi:hypothetical protein